MKRYARYVLFLSFLCFFSTLEFRCIFRYCEKLVARSFVVTMQLSIRWSNVGAKSKVMK